MSAVRAPVHDGSSHSDGWSTGQVLPIGLRLRADTRATGKGVTIAFLDSGFCPHPDLTSPRNRIRAFYDAADTARRLDAAQEPRPADWHGTSTSVVAAGNGWLSGGRYRGLASRAEVVLVAVGSAGRIREDDIARGLEWVIENRKKHRIRIVSISLGGDEDAPLEENRVNLLAEEAVRLGMVVIVAAGNSGCAENAHRSLPPATAPSVITVGGYEERGDRGANALALYCSSYGLTRDGLTKPELITLARGIAAPILPGTPEFRRAEALARLAGAPNLDVAGSPAPLGVDFPGELEGLSLDEIRVKARQILNSEKTVAAHYQHVDGTSFAAPIVASVAAQMLEVNPDLSPAAVKRLLLSTAERIGDASPLRQGHGVLRARAAVQAARREEHGRESSAFTAPRVVDGRLVFRYHDDEARRVRVSGEFNGWSPSEGQFTREANGTWRLEISAPPPGRYRYKFLIDETRWVEDPSHGVKEPDPFGGFDSVLTI